MKMHDLFDNSKIINFIREKQKEGILPKGRIKLDVAESLVGEYNMWRVRIKPFFKKPIFYTFKQDNLRLQITEDHSGEFDWYEF